MVEIAATVRGSGINVGKVSELCRDHIPREGSSKSGAVMPMPLACIRRLAQIMFKFVLPRAQTPNI